MKNGYFYSENSSVLFIITKCKEYIILGSVLFDLNNEDLFIQKMADTLNKHNITEGIFVWEGKQGNSPKFSGEITQKGGFDSCNVYLTCGVPFYCTVE